MTIVKWPASRSSTRPAVFAVAAVLSCLVVVAALGAPNTARSERASAGGATQAAMGYGWPLAPFNRKHPVRGNFGDPRMVFLGPPTEATLYHGTGSFHLHRGVDIYGARGAKVYPVRDGVVVFLSTSHVDIRASDGTEFEYWHIGAHLRPGTFVRADRTVLGAIGNAGHIDLTEVDNGHVVNPIAPGHLTPYRDTSRPVVSSIRLQSNNAGHVLVPYFVRGSVWLVAEAWDKPSLPLTGAWTGLPVTPAAVSWRIQQARGKIVVPTHVAADFRTSLRPSSAFWSVYARGTCQNMTTFGSHYSYMQPGSYLFLLSPTKFDTRALSDGVYDLVVTATDIRGNTGTRSLRFTVHNNPGWSGA